MPFSRLVSDHAGPLPSEHGPVLNIIREKGLHLGGGGEAKSSI